MGFVAPKGDKGDKGAAGDVANPLDSDLDAGGHAISNANSIAASTANISNGAFTVVVCGDTYALDASGPANVGGSGIGINLDAAVNGALSINNTQVFSGNATDLVLGDGTSQSVQQAITGQIAHGDISDFDDAAYNAVVVHANGINGEFHGALYSSAGYSSNLIVDPSGNITPSNLNQYTVAGTPIFSGDADDYVRGNGTCSNLLEAIFGNNPGFSPFSLWTSAGWEPIEEALSGALLSSYISDLTGTIDNEIDSHLNLSSVANGQYLRYDSGWHTESFDTDVALNFGNTAFNSAVDAEVDAHFGLSGASDGSYIRFVGSAWTSADFVSDARSAIFSNTVMFSGNATDYVRGDGTSADFGNAVAAYLLSGSNADGFFTTSTIQTSFKVVTPRIGGYPNTALGGVTIAAADQLVGFFDATPVGQQTVADPGSFASLAASYTAWSALRTRWSISAWSPRNPATISPKTSCRKLTNMSMFPINEMPLLLVAGDSYAAESGSALTWNVTDWGGAAAGDLTVGFALQALSDYRRGLTSFALTAAGLASVSGDVTTFAIELTASQTASLMHGIDTSLANFRYQVTATDGDQNVVTIQAGVCTVSRNARPLS